MSEHRHPPGSPEKLYTQLLRLYPAHFRETYGHDALQLFRDRSRDESGFFPKLRLWMDVLSDLAVSIPREYRHAPPAIAPVPVRERCDGAPAFQLLEHQTPRAAALLSALVLSLLPVGAVPVLVDHYGNFQHRDALTAFALARPAQTGSRSPATQITLDGPERRRVIGAAIANLKRYYIDPDIGEKTADALLAGQKSGLYEAVMDGAAFASLLTMQMRQVAHDPHLRMLYNAVKTPARPPGPPPPEVLADYRKQMEQNNCTFETVRILPQNIGYLKLNSFPYPPVCQSTATAVMASLNQADAIIFDLRDNGGGSPQMVTLLASYLFDHPTHLNDLYNRAKNSTQQFWTLPPIPGNKLADKPAYILTSARTFSAAEAFSYDLQVLKRATLVGETTAGGGYASSFHWIDDHFGIIVPDAMPINPISKRNWEGKGVEPDVKVNADDAQATAEKLARKR
jgi:hypothetical protein